MPRRAGKAVSDPWLSENILGTGGIVLQFLPERLDVGSQVLPAVTRTCAPRGTDQFGVGQSGTCIFHQDGKKVEFSGGEVNLFPVAPKCPVLQVEFEVARPQPRWPFRFCGRGAPQHCAHAGDDFAEPERSFHAIVRAGLKDAEVVFGGSAGTNDNDPEARRERSNPAACILTAVIGNFQIHQYEVEAPLCEHIERRLRAGRFGEKETGGVQGGAYHPTHSRITSSDEYGEGFRRHELTSPGVVFERPGKHSDNLDSDVAQAGGDTARLGATGTGRGENTGSIGMAAPGRASTAGAKTAVSGGISWRYPWAFAIQVQCWSDC